MLLHILRAVLLFVLIGGLGSPLQGCGIRQDELVCEEAVAHLEACCPGFDAEAVSCEYVAPQGCDGGHTPDISPTDSEALRAMSCQELMPSWCGFQPPDPSEYT